MSIYNKIEEIRRMPEKKRIKYVWMAVSISMFFLIIIWFFSAKELLNNEKQTISSSKNNFLISKEKKADNSLQ